jgi:hypothetical protein
MASRNPRVEALEKDLIDEQAQREQQIQTGTFRRETSAADSERKSLVHDRRKMSIQVGRRIRAPDRVLSRYAGVYGGTEKAESVYEAAIVEEDERVRIPETAKKYTLGSNQLGIVETARKNMDIHKLKLEGMFIVGV